MISFLSLFTHYSFACSCIGKSSIRKEMEHKDVVFVGKVISREIYQQTDTLLTEDSNRLSFKKAKYRILVTERLKGEIKTDTLTVFTGLGNGDCGVNFKLGENYIIYSGYENEHFNSGQKVDKFLATDLCTLTQLFTKKEFLRAKKCAKRKHYS